MVREGESGFLVSPNNHDEVAARITDLLGNAQLRAKMAERAIAFAREHFHPDRVAERTCVVYRKALANGHFAAATA
jgi:glycosyltransferase involved in cell wall biosynthesis